MIKLVSIIIVTYNRKKDLLDCLSSIQKLDYSNYEIIVVDNGSNDGTVEILKSSDYKLKLISVGKNLGTAASTNIGFNHSIGDYLLLLNDDVVLAENTVTELVKVMESEENIGVAGSLTYFYDLPHEIWFYPSWFETKKDKVQCIDWVTAVGCALMTKRSVVSSIGGFDNDYFYYNEESDFCFRVRKAGFRVVCALNSRIYHKIPSNDPLRQFSIPRAYYSSRNFFLFAKKNYSNTKDQLQYLLESFIYYPHFAKGKPILCHFPWIIPLKAMLSLKFSFLIAYFRGIADGLVWYLNRRTR